MQTVVPRSFSVEQNYPNPFNPATAISYYLPVEGHVTLRVYNILGQVMRTLVDEVRSAGDQIEVWDGRSDEGGSLASGIYLYRLESGEQAYSRKMVLLK